MNGSTDCGWNQTYDLQNVVWYHQLLCTVSIFARLPMPMLLAAHGIATCTSRSQWCLHTYWLCVLPNGFSRKRETARSLEHCQHSKYVWYLAGMFISFSENRKLWNRTKSTHWNCVSQAMMFLWSCQQAVEKVKFTKCLVWQGFSPWTGMQTC